MTSTCSPWIGLALLAGLTSMPWAKAQSPTLAEAANQPATTTGAAGLLRAQVLLDRAGFSPGEIDAQAGSNQARALRGYQGAKNLQVTGKLDPATWAALNADAPPVLASYTVTDADASGPYAKLPKDIGERGKLKAMGFESVAEALGEKFHASPKLLAELNPGADLAKAGTLLQVPNVADVPPAPKAAKVVVDKSESTLSLMDAGGRIVAQVPVSSGSEHDPLPIGDWKTGAIATNPAFHYNPELFWDADPSHAKTTLAPGPNNPVGTVWIDLSKPHYGLHGTPEPAAVGKTQSHGCVRMTNWDAARVAAAVGAGTVVVMQE